MSRTFGSITIVDTTDIEEIYMVYVGSSSDTTAPDASNFSLWKRDITQITGDYIWQRTVVKKSGITITSSNFQEYYGDPVCITGPEGAQGPQGQTGPQGGTGPAGKGVKSVLTYYLLSSVNTGTPTETNWRTTPQNYPTTGTKYYWTKTITTYTDNTTYESSPVYNSILTNSVKEARDANKTASDALNIANDAADDASDALGIANQTQNNLTTYQSANDTRAAAIESRAKYFWWDSEGAHIASGVNETMGVSEPEQNKPSTYGFNALTAPGALKLRRYATDLAVLDTGSLSFYIPPTNWTTTSPTGPKAIELTTQGLYFYQPNSINNKMMELTPSALTFYNPNDGTTAQAVLNSNGLVLKRGGIEAGFKNTTDYIYVWSYDDATNHTININNSGNKSDWRIIAGNKFGVDKAGNLYATNAEISGKITATSLTIGSGATVSGLSTSNISGMNNYALQSDLNTEIAQRKAVYAVSTTGATTAAKTTESGTPSGFVLYNGATVTVKFNSANSTTTPTLNVNGTGAKTIKSYTGAALTAAEYTWPAGAAITFTYDGSYWRMQDSGALQAKADAAASASSASSSASAASSSASSASTSASNASSSATSASNSASTASTKATEASNSASTASSKASAASTSATNAANSASAASTSATNASNSADVAASSASDASDSADAAASSASTASSKATAAANSATSASNSASSASSSATSASNSASSASSSATTATNKANAASESATNAANSATAASGSATSAANSATAASNSATSASNSATAASNSATAAAEVMGGFTILWNYSAFGTATAGDAFICGFDPATGTKSDGNGWVKWNGTKRTITKQQVNPGTIVPYNIPIYIVCRLSSATATTGTNYMVWYNAGWKYATCPSPTAVGGSWTWTDNRDIILGSFVETGANEALTECELFNPPWTSKQITTNTTTPTSYIMDVDSNKGITVKPKDSSGNDFLQMNSTAIEFFRNSTTASVMRLTDNSFRLGLEASNHTTIDTNGLHIWAGTESTATNELALFSTTARIGKTNNSRFLMNASSLQAYNSSNKLYFEVSSSGIKYGTDLSSTSTTTTVASTTYADGKATTAESNAKAAAQGYANTAEANASYSVEIEVSSIDFVNNSATLVAIPYYQGSTTMPTGVTLSYRWYKNGTALTNTSTAPTISGATTNTLQLGQGTDFGSSTTNAIYTCVIS